ncbi:hypothetical protein D3C80_825960 [compost metagenome]
MDAPVGIGDDHGLARGGQGSGLGFGRRDIVLHRLGHGEIHQADAHARREQHRQPRDVGEVRLGVVRPQLQPPGRADRQNGHEQQEACYSGHVEPAEGVDHPGLGGAEDQAGSGGRQKREQQQPAGNGAGPPEDTGVHLGRQHGAPTQGYACGSKFGHRPAIRIKNM